MSSTNKPMGFSMPMYRDIVPKAIRPWIYVLIALCFQLTGGVYLGSLNNMIGGNAVMREDILMCMYATLCGMAIYFPILFRMKFRFTNKTLLLCSALTIALCNYLSTVVDTLPLLWLVCFISGCAKIQGTFECMSNIQLWISPKREFTVFFPVLHIIILSSIQISDIMAIWLSDIATWHYMHLLIIGITLCICMFISLFTKHVRIIKKMPLVGIDWLGAILWAVISLCIAYLFNYGEWYNWWESRTVCNLTTIIILLIVAALYRMNTIRHPYIEPAMWKYKHLPTILLLIGIVEAILASEHVLENIFYEDGMEYSEVTCSILNIPTLTGILIGCGFSLLWMKVLKLSYLRLIMVGLLAVSTYIIMFYLTISTDINIEKLYPIVGIRGFGYAVLSITFMTTLEEIMTFKHFFQSLSVFNMIHMLLGGVMGCAAYAFGIRYLVADNISRIGLYIDNVNRDFNISHNIAGIMTNIQMVSIKQLFGVVSFISLAMIIGAMLYDMPYTRSNLKRIPHWRPLGIKLRRESKH